MSDFSVAMPYQFYDLVMVFVTVLALLWGMVAIKRVYRMLRVRSAVLSDRVIQIRGLGSYLTYFDGATRTHLEAVVHTRQSMPPVVMEPLLVNATCKSLGIVGGTDKTKFVLSLNIHALQNSRVICLFNFNEGNFQRMVQQNRADSGDSAQSRSQLFHSLTGLRENAVTAPSAAFPRFQRSECCSFECLCAEVAPGEHSLALPLLPIMSSWLSDRLASSVLSGDDKVTIAVLLVPSVEARGGTPSKSAGGARTADTTAYALEEGDGEHGEVGSPEEEPLHGAGYPSPAKERWSRSSGRNPMTSGVASSPGSRGGVQTGPSAITCVFAAAFAHAVPLQSLRAAASAAATAPAGEWRAASSACEVLVLDGRGQLYQSQEVFGLAPVVAPASPQPTAAATTPAPSTTSTVPSPSEAAGAGAGAAGCGGCMVTEDCVVCLTVPKEVLLLPCRHLCVCESCLVFLDKCPVCRAAFEEYITIRTPQNQPQTQPQQAGVGRSIAAGTALESTDAAVLQI